MDFYYIVYYYFILWQFFPDKDTHFERQDLFSVMLYSNVDISVAMTMTYLKEKLYPQ